MRRSLRLLWFYPLILATLSCGGSSDGEGDSTGSSGRRADVDLCEEAAEHVEPGSELAAVVSVAEGVQCVYFSSRPSGQVVECPDGSEVAPRYRQTVTIASDDTITSTEPEVVSDPCPG